jgi:phospholipid-binding lipoprotein MlaA
MVNLIVKLALLMAASILYGCATTRNNEAGAVTPDPFEQTNRSFYRLDDTLDRAILKPVAETYADIMPDPLRVGVTNFFDNLYYPNVILNSFLQGKVNQGISDTARFVFNSTLGIGGLFDVATGMGLPRHEEDFGQTLAVWGFKSGAYLYIPIVEGPSSVRDAPDIATSTLLNPLTYISSIVLWPVSALNIVNKRANLLDDTTIRDEAAVDPYSFTREAYMQRREFLIHDGNLPTEGYDDLFEDDGNGDEPELKIE